MSPHKTFVFLCVLTWLGPQVLRDNFCFTGTGSQWAPTPAEEVAATMGRLLQARSLRSTSFSKFATGKTTKTIASQKYVKV